MAIDAIASSVQVVRTEYTRSGPWAGGQTAPRRQEQNLPEDSAGRVGEAASGTERKERDLDRELGRIKAKLSEVALRGYSPTEGTDAAAARSDEASLRRDLEQINAKLANVSLQKQMEQSREEAARMSRNLQGSGARIGGGRGTESSPLPVNVTGILIDLTA